jgi:hypothetical protein
MDLLLSALFAIIATPPRGAPNSKKLACDFAAHGRHDTPDISISHSDACREVPNSVDACSSER